MAKYLFAFSSVAMVATDHEFAQVGEDAVAWTARIAKACRCEQALRVVYFDPFS